MVCLIPYAHVYKCIYTHLLAMYTLRHDPAIDAFRVDYIAK
jgi:hypothetical protein